MRKIVESAIVLSIVLFVVACGGGTSGTGTLTGMITGGDAPMAGVQVILCAVAGEDAEEHLICTLRGAPTATTGSDGSFEIADVPTGDYIVMYGLPGILELTPEAWDGIPVTRGSFCMEGMRNSVCDMNGVTPSLFWSEGALQVGDTISGMHYQDYEKQPGVVILGTGEGEGSAADMHIFMGTLQSVYTGIAANISAGQYAPEVEIISGETANSQINVPMDKD